MSSCSAKLRIYLRLKGLAWESHEVDLARAQNISEWYLGINPRGLVPTLVDDGDVHIESNDILLHLERKFPSPSLIRDQNEGAIAAMLKHEDDLHLDLRSLSMRYVFNPPGPPKSDAVLETYRRAGAGTVQGVEDANKQREIEYWTDYAINGVTDETVRRSVGKFREAFEDIENRLDGAQFLLGDNLSLLDIAWFIYVNRLTLAGYPLARLHPRLSAWFDRLAAMPEFAPETGLPPPLMAHVLATRDRNRAAGLTLEQVAGI
jgi:glutathione S-transferase